MVGRWGMSEAIGLVSVLPAPGDESTLFPGVDGNGPSEATRELVDSEVRRIVEECYAARSTACASTATSSTRWPRRCSSTRRSTSARPTPRPASTARSPTPSRPPAALAARDNQG